MDKMKAVNQPVDKFRRFLWRSGRNLLCTTPIGRRLLFPSHVLATRFGRDDANHTISVFVHHIVNCALQDFVRPTN